MIHAGWMSEWAVYGKVKRFAAQRFPPARSPHFASWELEPQASCSGERTHGLAGEGRDIGDRSGLLEPRPRQGTRNGFPACALSSLHEQPEGTLASAALDRSVIPHVTPLANAWGLGPGVSRLVGPESRRFSRLLCSKDEVARDTPAERLRRRVAQGKA